MPSRSLAPDDPETPAFAQEARLHYEAVGARAYLDRLDEALARTARPARASAVPTDAVPLAREA